MKVLFVSSGNSNLFRVSPMIADQAISLREKGIEVAFCAVEGRGWRYLANVGRLRTTIRRFRPDVVHAHYSLSGLVAVLGAGRVPVVLSLMGDDAQGTFTAKGKIRGSSRLVVLLTVLVQPFLSAVIYKAENLGTVIWRKRIAYRIPNGVRLDQFRIMDGGCREGLGLDHDREYVLFLGNPCDLNKNVKLVEDAVALLNEPRVELLQVFGVSRDAVARYLNSVDVFVLCSFGEGSPNVVKEAMACNCPAVVTPAGDAAIVTHGTEGYFVSDYDAADFAEKLKSALDFSRTRGRTSGRKRLIELGLDAETVADQLIDVYRSVARL